MLKLLVSFEQNLKEVFQFEQFPALVQKPHLLYSNEKSQYLFTLGPSSQLNRTELDFIENQDKWIGLVPSIFYSPNDCYYVFGEPNKESNKIRRLTLDLEDQEMVEMSIKLKTKRMNFGFCLFNDEIYIIGGENSKEGCLVKC